MMHDENISCANGNLFVVIRFLMQSKREIEIGVMSGKLAVAGDQTRAKQGN